MYAVPYHKYSEDDNRLILLITQLEEAGLNISLAYNGLQVVLYFPYESMYINFFSDRDTTCYVYSDQASKRLLFSDFFESLETKYKEIFCFYLDLFGSNAGRRDPANVLSQKI
jgi:hypothetical protein